MTARDRAAVRIAATLPPVPELPGLGDRVAALDGLRQAGQWTQLAAELDAIEQQAAAAAERSREAERSAVALVDRRDELRGLLDAYQARAARLGASRTPTSTPATPGGPRAGSGPGPATWRRRPMR